MNRLRRNILNVLVALLIMSAVVLTPTLLIRILMWEGSYRIFNTEYLPFTPWELTQSRSIAIAEDDIVPIRFGTLTFNSPFGQCETIDDYADSIMCTMDLGDGLFLLVRGPSSSSEELQFYKEGLLAPYQDSGHALPAGLYDTLDSLTTSYDFQMHFLNYHWSHVYFLAGNKAFVKQYLYFTVKGALTMYNFKDNIFYFDDSPEIQVLGEQPTSQSSAYATLVYDRDSDQYYSVIFAFKDPVENHRDYLYYILQSMKIEP